MSKKNRKKNKIEKNSSNFSEVGFDKSILSNYSQWREDYSTEDITEEDSKKIKIEDINEQNEQKNEKEDLDFKSNLINSEVKEDTFSTGDKKIDNKSNSENLENIREDEILTETQRLKLIYGNVVPLHERRRRGIKNFDNKVIIEDRKIDEEKNSKDLSKSFESLDKKDFSEEKEKNFVNKEIVNEKKEEIKKDFSKNLMPKVPKVLKFLFAITICLAISIVGFFGLKAYNSIGVKLPNLISGIESKKIGFYTKNIIFNGNTIDKNQAESLISLLDGDDNLNLNMISKWLKEDAENLEKDDNYKSKRPVSLQKSGKILGIFDDYKICLSPIKLKVEKSDKVETTIFLNGKEESISDKEYDLFPGKYTIFYYDNNVKLKDEVDLFYDEKSEVKTVSYGEATDYKLANEVIKLDTNAKDSSFKILTRDENSILFVNDKNTELTVKEFNKLSGTNIKKDDVLKVVTKMPWGYTISDGVTYNGESTLNVSTSLSDERLIDVAISRSIELLKEDVQSRGKKDASLLTIMIDPSLHIEKNRVDSLINSGREYVGGYPSVEFDLNSFEIREQGDTYEMYIGGHLLVQETTYGKNEKPPQLSSITPVESKVGFHFLFDKERKNWYSNVWGFTTRTITRNNIKSFDLSKDMIAR